MAFIKEGTLDHVGSFARTVRLADQIEALKTHATDEFMFYCIVDSIHYSERTYTIFNEDNKPIAMFGIAKGDGQGVGVPWLICSEEVLTFANRKKLIPMGKRFLRKVLVHNYTRLENCVDPENHDAIRFIRAMGFRFTGSTVKTKAGYDFLVFEMRREDV